MSNYAATESGSLAAPGGEPEDSPAVRLAELLAWIDESGVRQARVVPADMLRLSVESVAIAEQAVVAAAATAATTLPAADVRLTLPPRALLRPTDARVVLAGVSNAHAPGEHVVYICSSGPVPFGERGIVVAVQGTRVEVLFEKEGYCGTGHFAQLGTCRGAVLPSAALLNLTKPLPAAYRAAKARRPDAHPLATGAAGGAGYSGRRFGGAEGHARDGIPSNIWTLLEVLDGELAEPEWLPTAATGAAVQPAGVTASFENAFWGGEPGGKAMGKAAARRARHASALEAKLAAAEVD